MKKNLFLVGALLWALSCFFACSEEDGGVPTRGKIDIYGQSFRLSSGVIWQNNPNTVVSTVPYVWEDSYVNGDGEEVTDRVEGFRAGDEQRESGNFLLSLYEEGLVYHPALEAAKGRGACICFHLASAEKERLVPGKYVFSDSREGNTFMGYYSSEHNTLESVPPAVLTGGEVVIGQAGEEFRVAFRCETQGGAVLSGEYAGRLDVCRVSQVNYSEYGGVALSGLMDSVTTKIVMDLGWGPMDAGSETTIDEGCGKAFFSLSSGISQTAVDAQENAGAVDLALRWKEEEGAFLFESPIRMRGKLGHQDAYNFPCHTVYMKAPESFTDADFENLSAENFTFEIKDETVEVPTRDFKPMYVFFESGKGVRGVIRVYGHTPLGQSELPSGFYTIIAPVNPALLLDIKCPAAIDNPQIR